MDSAPSAHVEFERVCKSYDGRVVRDLDLSVYEGSSWHCWALPGSGKTACLMMLAGFEAPTSGSIRTRGRPVNDLPPPASGLLAASFRTTRCFPT